MRQATAPGAKKLHLKMFPELPCKDPRHWRGWRWILNAQVYLIETHGPNPDLMETFMNVYMNACYQNIHVNPTS